MSESIYLNSFGMCCALGRTPEEIAARLFSGDTSGMRLETGWRSDAPARVGVVAGDLPGMPTAFSDYACRTTRLALLALSPLRPRIDQAIRRFGAGRIAVVIGTSTSGIAEGEAAVAEYRRHGVLPEGYRYLQQELGMPSAFVARYLGVRGPTFGVSTACTSSAKALVSATRLLRSGLCDAVVAGGVDSLCRLTINGFAALESTSVERCNPMSRNRAGINIGEGCALFLMSRERGELELLGAGESSDAYHMSAPHPEGRGAERAMRAALADAGLTADEVDYLNLHATATPKNDEMESRAVSRVFPAGVPASGTKPMTGHLLGAAGAVELGLCALALAEGRLPPHVWDGEADPALPALDLVGTGRRFARTTQRACMSNSFAFGGSNTCLLIGDAR